MRKKKVAKKEFRIAVIDSETDPFKFGRKPLPFVWGFFDGETYMHFWGDNCTEQLLTYLESRKDPLTIYAHNGGKFDFFFLLEFGAIQNPALIINGRIVKARLLGIHEVRDSYAILPSSLEKMGNSADGNKKKINYEIMERGTREKHKQEILDYLEPDCTVLYSVVSKFCERYGPKVTVGAMAISELQKHHPVIRLNKTHDELFRPFYFGGRVECFESGKLQAPEGKPWKIYDVNSMYPAAMKNYDHPCGEKYIHPDCSKFDKRTGTVQGFAGMYFMHFIGWNKGALPKRAKNGGLDFDCEYGEFFACSHEIKAAIALKLIRVDTIIDIAVPCNFMRFDKFVDTYSEEKRIYKQQENAAYEMFSKYTLNSAYGKFASNPDNFKEWYIVDEWADEKEQIAFEEWRDQFNIEDDDGNVTGCSAELVQDMGRFEIWQAPALNDERGYFDVAIAASITSAARATLLKAIHSATRPIYCDTDSLICQGLSGVPIDEFVLGAWKFEGSSNCAYIAGKKMYALELHQLDKDGKPKIKIASKGAKLSFKDMQELCQGKTIEWKNDAPNFKFSGETKFVRRKIVKSA